MVWSKRSLVSCPPLGEDASIHESLFVPDTVQEETFVTLQKSFAVLPETTIEGETRRWPFAPKSGEGERQKETPSEQKVGEVQVWNGLVSIVLHAESVVVRTTFCEEHEQTVVGVQEQVAY